MNLLDETLEAIRANGKRMEDVSWVGLRDIEIPWSAFEALADREYDNSFGTPEVACDLVVAFRDGSWLEREEYDGAEWWAFKCTPRRPAALMDAPPPRRVGTGAPLGLLGHDRPLAEMGAGAAS